MSDKVDRGELKNIPIIKLKGFDFSGYIRRGTGTRIAKQFGMSSASISRIIHGSQYNPDVIKEIVKVISQQESISIPSKIANKIVRNSSDE